MTDIEATSELCYETYGPTDMLLKIAVMETGSQHVKSEEIHVEPALDLEELERKPGQSRLHRLTVKADARFTISYKALVELTPPSKPPNEVRETDIAELPESVYRYLNPSRYCESAELTQLALNNFGDSPRGYQRVQQISDWVHGVLAYTPGSSDTSTTAQQALVNKQGVCRDYAHLAIALCRAVGIPARYLSGYAVDLQPPDFHGFFEAYLDGRWRLFDPTKLASAGGLVRIANGLDAAETAFNSIFGSAALVSMNVLAVDLTSAVAQDGPGVISPPTTPATTAPTALDAAR